MAELSEAGIIQTHEVLKYSSPGYLWIYFQYLEHGQIEAIETAVRKAVTSRDFYGPLFENTRHVLDRLKKMSEHERVIRLHQAAILHRYKALTSEHAIYMHPKKKIEDRNASRKWVRHYLPPFRRLVSDYEILLTELSQSDPNTDSYRDFIQSIKESLV